MKRLLAAKKRQAAIMGILGLVSLLSFSQSVAASPFGQGVFGADVPFGSVTSLTIALGGNVALNLEPDGSNLTDSDSHTLTVTSTDVVGYYLYAFTPGNSDMVSGGATIAASANVSPAALAVNSWGFNTTGATTFTGMQTIPQVIKDASGPHKDGDNTIITYSALTDSTQAAGTYEVSVTYIAVAKNQ